MSRRTEPRAGFTLIELLVVLVIIATLATVVGPALFGNVAEARRTAARAQLDALTLALDAYRLDLARYPTTDQGLEALRRAPDDPDDASRWRGPYLRKDVPLDPWGFAWIYAAPGIETDEEFELYSPGRDGRRGGTGEDADVTSWSAPSDR